MVGARGVSAGGLAVVLAWCLYTPCAWGAEGIPDPAFGSGGVASYQLGFGHHSPSSGFRGVAVAAGGSIYADGVSLTGGGEFLVLVARLTESGALDPRFGVGGALVNEPVNEQGSGTQDEYANAISLEANEDAIAAGNVIERVTPGGAMDPAYGPTYPRMEVNALTRVKGGRLALAGYQGDVATIEPAALEVRLPGGQPDPAFGHEGLVTMPSHAGEYSRMVASSVVELAGGDLLLAGYGNWAASGTEGGHPVVWLARVTPSGAMDPSFGAGGILYMESLAGAAIRDTAILEPRPGGLVLVAATPTGVEGAQQMAAWGLTASGAPDASYGSGGISRLPIAAEYDSANVDAAATDAGGRLLVAGTLGNTNGQVPRPPGRPELVRVAPDGHVEAGFGAGGVARGPLNAGFNALAVDGAGRILAAGDIEGKAMVERFLTSGAAAAGPSGAPVAPLGSPAPPASVARDLGTALASLARRSTIRLLLTHHGVRLSLALPVKGSLRIDWWVTVRTRHGGRTLTRRVLICSGRGTVGPAGRATLWMRLTRRGTALLRAARRRPRVEVAADFARATGGHVHASLRFTLRVR
jgi:uncharacterized delta-60 repeat protein